MRGKITYAVCYQTPPPQVMANMGIPIDWADFRLYLQYKAHRKVETLETCHRVFGALKQYFQDKELTETNVFVFFDYLKSKGDKNSTINNYLKYLHHIGKILNLQWLLDIKYLPEEQEIFDTLTPDEIRAILICHPKRYEAYSYMNVRWDTIIECLLATGLRRQELCNLTWNDLQGNKLIIRHTKNKIDRYAVISSDLSKRIQELDHFNEYIFGTRKGQLIAHEINDELKTRAKLIGCTKHITSHSLRRTCATEAAAKGINLAYIQRFLGHKSVQTTSHYIQVDEQALKAVSKSLTVNEGSINMEDVYERVRKVAQEFIPNFKVELKKTKSGVRLFICE